MRKIGRFVQLIDAETLHSIQSASPDYQRGERPRLTGVAANNDQMQLSSGRECITACFYPRILMHGAGRFLCQERPTLRLALDGAKFLDDAHRRGHSLHCARTAPKAGFPLNLTK